MTPIAPSLQQPVDAFLRYLKVERQLSPLTQLSYSRQLAALMRPAQEIGVTDWTALDAARVRMLAARSKRAGLQSASGAAALFVAQFPRLAGQRGVLHSNPAKGIRTPRSAAICRKTSTSMK